MPTLMRFSASPIENAFGVISSSAPHIITRVKFL